MTDGDLAYASIADVAPLIAAGEVSPVELTQACLDRIARLDPAINAFITVLADSALQEAGTAKREIQQGHYRGPLHGIPIAHKDLYHTRGVRTTAGSKVLADFVPDHDATVVAKLRTAGTVLLGKLNMHEFAAGGTNENIHYGDAHNPWHLAHSPGGSSGGSAAALAAGMCLGSTGSDTAGSIRIPSSHCATTGIKPTYGLVSRFGVVPLSWSLDHAGPMTRSAHDAALMLNVMAGFDRQDSGSVERPGQDYTAELEAGVRGLRLGIPRTYFNTGLAPDIERAWRDAIEVLIGLGAVPVEVEFTHLDDAVNTGMTITRAEVAHVARLARLGLTDDEMDQLASELDHILDAMQELRQLDTSAIPPTAQVIPLQNVMRDDVPRPASSVEDILLNAPQTHDGQFLVPPVLE